MIDTPEAKFAVSAVREAAQLVRQVQAEMVSDALTKGDKSPVTVGDFAAQALVAKRLSESLPSSILVGEENASDLRTPEGADTLHQVTDFVANLCDDATPEKVCDWIDWGATDISGEMRPTEYWTLDPIDGTKGFLRGDQYAVALALIRDGQVQLGVLGCPELAGGTQADRGGFGTLMLAVRGQGTHMQQLVTLASPRDVNDWQEVKVSDINQPAETRMLRSVEKGHTNLGAIDHLATAMGIEADPVGMDSQAKYAVLAAGGGEMLVRLLSEDRPDYREKIWDQAAGSIVIEEAGGKVTDLDGKPLDFSRGRTLSQNRGVLATNGQLHEAALAGLREIGA